MTIHNTLSFFTLILFNIIQFILSIIVLDNLYPVVSLAILSYQLLADLFLVDIVLCLL